jgi:hypothetical protein
MFTIGESVQIKSNVKNINLKVGYIVEVVSQDVYIVDLNGTRIVCHVSQLCSKTKKENREEYGKRRSRK